MVLLVVGLILYLLGREKVFTKLEKLKNWFEDKERVALAFSGGVDSALLLKVGEMTLGSGLSAITIHSPLNKEEELKVAQRLAENLKVEQIVVNLNDLEIAEVASNHSERCYYCKKNRFEKLISLIKEKNIKWIIEGSNLDDLKDYRPGLRAVKELGIRSPLQEIGFTKKEIRNLARYLDVPVWNKPSEPCLATRFPVGTNLNLDNLKRIEQCEEYVKRLLDIKILRIRDYNNLARIEVLEEDIKLLLQNKVEITRELKKKGFKYITLDLNGYKQGSMNNTGGS